MWVNGLWINDEEALDTPSFRRLREYDKENDYGIDVFELKDEEEDEV